MRKRLVIFILLLGIMSNLSAQTEEAQQLLLNVEKLAQLKQILHNMKKGYQIVSTGYTGIKNISQGNFDLHKTFLDGLLAINPTVRNYRKVNDIIRYQLLLVKEYKYAYSRFKQDDNFTPQEVVYLQQVYTNLFNQSLKNLDALATVITAKKMRMSDDERLKAIDAIFLDVHDKLVFLKQFNRSTTILGIQRAKERQDLTSIKEIYGLTN